jgi:hypothetical protein
VPAFSRHDLRPEGERTTSSHRRQARTYRSDATKNNLQRTGEAATVAAITDDE